ncbi:MAG: hypothetical protein RJQ00_06485 [Vicingaceae bacterium]
MNKGMIAFIVLLIFNYIALVFLFENGSSENSEAYKEQIEHLKEENEVLKEANLQLDQEVAVLTEEKDSLTTAITIKATAIEHIKTERDETMDNINGMDNNELYGFFSNFKTDSLNGQFGH